MQPDQSEQRALLAMADLKALTAEARVARQVIQVSRLEKEMQRLRAPESAAVTLDGAAMADRHAQWKAAQAASLRQTIEILQIEIEHAKLAAAKERTRADVLKARFAELERDRRIAAEARRLEHLSMLPTSPDERYP